MTDYDPAHYRLVIKFREYSNMYPYEWELQEYTRNGYWKRTYLIDRTSDMHSKYFWAQWWGKRYLKKLRRALEKDSKRIKEQVVIGLDEL